MLHEFYSFAGSYVLDTVRQILDIRVERGLGKVHDHFMKRHEI